MARYPRVRDQHIAVFGESGSGKTVLVSSFFGPTQEGSFNNNLWDLVADDTGQGNRLYRNYVGLRDHAALPTTTRFESTTYCFSVKLKEPDERSSVKRPFDTLRLAWHDYPGDWFHESPSSDEESKRRVDTFRSLLRSDVALILVDAQKLREHEGEEERYLKSLFTNYRQTLLRMSGDLLGGESRLVEFPRIWIIALSKADLYPEWDVYAFRDLLLWKAGDHVERLREAIAGLVETPGALSVGEDFMLLSSAKFALSRDGGVPESIDVTKRVGLDLMLPIAAVLPLERRVQWHERMEIPRKVLESLADGADGIAASFSAGRAALVGKLLAKVPNARVASAAGVSIAWAGKLAGEQLKEANKQARERKDVLAATLTQFKLDLEQGGRDRLLIRSTK